MNKTLIIVVVLVLIAGIAIYAWQTDVFVTDTNESTATSTVETAAGTESPIVIVNAKACALTDCEAHPGGYVAIFASKDSSHVYLKDGSILAEADPSSFIVLKTEDGAYSAFAKDKSHFFDLVNGTVLAEADAVSFKVESQTTAHDKSHSYSVAF